MNEETLTALLDPWDHDCPGLECDGFSRIASYLLRRAGIEHTVMRGSVRSPWGKIPLHLWIETGEFTVDYRLRMWLGDKAPHGVFDASEHRRLTYRPEAAIAWFCDDFLFEVLTGKPA